MMLIEQTKVPARSLPLGAFKKHLRLGTGFDDDGIDETLLSELFRAAIAVIEGRTGKALLTRRFTWSLTAWSETGRQVLPIAPVREVVALREVDAREATETIPAEKYILEPDMHRPRVRLVGGTRPPMPRDGRIEVDFEAGFGPDWREVPDELARAVFLLAAHYHEHRYVTGDGERSLPFGVTALMERWRPVRTLGGRVS